MKIYIATRRQENARPVREAILAAGHICTASWINDEDYGKSITDERRISIALRDLAEISMSDCLIVVSEPDGSMVKGGKHVEMGFALGIGVQVFLLGEPENIFHYHPSVVVFTDLNKLVKELSK